MADNNEGMTMDNYKGSELYKRRRREDAMMLFRLVVVFFGVFAVMEFLHVDWVVMAVWFAVAVAVSLAIGALISTMRDRG